VQQVPRGNLDTLVVKVCKEIQVQQDLKVRRVPEVILVAKDHKVQPVYQGPQDLPVVKEYKDPSVYLVLLDDIVQDMFRLLH
jgi:hypothetical protein